MKQTALRSTLLLGVLAAGVPARGDDPALREQARAALRKAVEFYRTKVSTQGGYHFHYAEDLSYGRSEMSEGPTRVEVQRDGTPLVGMAYLDAYEATGDSYYLEAGREVAHALVRGQYCSGGWDYYVEFDPGKRRQYPYRADGACRKGAVARSERERPTTLDDNITQAAVRLLMRVDRDLGFKDAQIHEAALFALDSLIKAQYPNGAWPQRFSRIPDPKAFPVKPASYPDSWSRTWPGADYQSHYTFNDDSIIDMIDAMLEAARIYTEPQYLASAEKGGDFILLAQMPDPQPGWAQQYDRDMHPAWARRFEPPSITGGESQSVMKALLLLFRETGKRKYLEPLSRALAYYRRSLLPDTDSPSEIRRRACPERTPCLARFAELKTNRPLYITKGTRVTALDQATTNVDGYELSYSDESVITHYAVLVSGAVLAEIEQEYRELQSADPTSPKRPDRLHGLSPWNARSSPIVNLEARVRAAIDAMDARGAWVEEGSIGKANRLVSVFAGRDLVVTLGGKTLSMKENDTLEVFAGADPPKQRIIRTRTFAENIGILSAYLASPQTKPGLRPGPRLGRLRGPRASARSRQVSFGRSHGLNPAPLPRGRAVRAAVMRRRVQNSRSDAHNGANGDQAGRGNAADIPALPYKLVDWPIPPTSVAGVPAGPWNFIQVASVAVTRRGNILVLHRGAHPIMEFDSSGKFVRSWGDGLFSEGKVAAIPQMYWTDDKSHYSAVYGPAGCASCGAHSVRIDPQGNIWVVDASGHVVYKLNPDGKEIMRLGTKGVAGTSSNTFNLPTDVAFGPAGEVYVSDGYGSARVVKYSRDGKFLLQWGRRGKGPGEFGLPHNLVVDAQGRVYVTDRDNQRIEVFDSNGKFLTEWTATGPVSGLAITKDQRIWAGPHLRDLDGPVLGRLPGATGAHGVAVSDSGDVYLAQLGGVVQKFVALRP